MRAKTVYWDREFERSESPAFSLGKSFIWVTMIILVFLIVYVRHLCVREGYEISRLASDLNEMEIQHQLMLEKKSAVMNMQKMYETGEHLGLVLPDPDRTFNVQ
jgi:hypothetical protein